jgi:hypothetical protein
MKLPHSRTPALPHSRTPALPHSRTPGKKFHIVSSGYEIMLANAKSF